MAVTESSVIGTHCVMDAFGNNLASTDHKPLCTKIIPQQSFLVSQCSRSWIQNQQASPGTKANVRIKIMQNESATVKQALVHTLCVVVSQL